MKFFDRDGRTIKIWIPIVAGPAAALIAFVVGYWLDPLGLKEAKGVAAFFLSVLLLMIAQWLVTVTEVQKTAIYSDRLYDAIKNYLHVTKIGSPEEALRYIHERLPVLREVQNTRLNIPEEIERSDEKLYVSSAFEDLLNDIPAYCKSELIWKDIGDSRALSEFRQVRGRCVGSSEPRSTRYKYKLLSHVEPQINFILLEYRDGAKEVLFNWDFRSVGQDPTVLISRDQHIVEMFAVQFSMLWRRATEDHDNQATKSTSMK
ncbi:MAG: hypothetical protein KUL88_00595 [Rhizobium sp.]|nr:hypothetical protein [Rhizobium sp.]